jgi:hypothetical protein
MKIQRFVIVLTALNLLLLGFLLTEMQPLVAQGVAPVLRGRALEILDERGRVWAEIKVLPAQPALKMPDGTVGYPETVQLRLLDSQNGPHVKLTATEDGSGMVLGGEGGYTQLSSRGKNPLIKIVTADGREQTITP